MVLITRTHTPDHRAPQLARLQGVPDCGKSTMDSQMGHWLLLQSLEHQARVTLSRRAYQCIIFFTLCRGLLVVVNPSGTAAKEVTTAAAEKHWGDAAAQVLVEANPSQSAKEPAQLEFDITYVQTNADACKAIHRALSNLRLAFRHYHRGLSNLSLAFCTATRGFHNSLHCKAAIGNKSGVLSEIGGAGACSMSYFTLGAVHHAPSSACACAVSLLCLQFAPSQQGQRKTVKIRHQLQYAYSLCKQHHMGAMIRTCYASCVAQGKVSHTSDPTMSAGCGTPSNISSIAYLAGITTRRPS